MKLALSGRLWEGRPDKTTFREQIQIANELGYDGIEMRYGVLPPREEWESTRAALQEAGLELIFTPSSGLPKDEEKKTELIHLLDALQFLGGHYVRSMGKSPDELDALRLTAELAAERGIGLVSQLHVNTLTDTVERSQSTLHALEKHNVGLIFDACHIPFVENVSIEEAVQQLWPWIKLVNLQSYKPSREDDGRDHININGRDWSLAMPGEPDGTDLVKVVRAMRQSGFDGWYTVMPAVDSSMKPIDVAREYKRFLDALD